MKTDPHLPYENQRLLSTAETAKFLAVSQRTLWTWTNQGRLACVQIDRTKRYRMSEILKFLEANTSLAKIDERHA